MNIMPFEIIFEFNGLSGYKPRHDGYSGQPRCATCNATLDINIQKYDCPNKLSVKTGDISMTADGVVMVSTRFCDTYNEAQLSGLLFSKLKNGYFAVDTNYTVKIPPSKYRVYEGEALKHVGNIQS